MDSTFVQGKNTIALGVCLAISVVFALQVAAHAEDQQKAEKEHRLATSGTTLAGIASQLHASKTIWEVGNEQHADWRQIANDAKKLNDRIEAAFYNFFKDGRPDAVRGSSDGYHAAKDSIAADQEGLTKQDIASAQDTYLRCFRRARGEGASHAEMQDERDHTPPQAEGDPR